jgi:hypothetical protein
LRLQGRDFEKYVRTHENAEVKAPPSAMAFGLSTEKLNGLLSNAGDDSCSAGSCSRFASKSMHSSSFDPGDPDLIINPDDRHPLTGSLSSSQKTKVIQLLGAWEEPTITEEATGTTSVNALLQFRRAHATLRVAYPFSGSFGLADSR